MTKKELKITILSNIAVLALTFVMLVSASLAWFFSGASLKVEQSLQVGQFIVNVTEGKVGQSTGLIAIDKAYPMSFAKAVSLATMGEKNVYTFSVQNEGNVNAQLLISAKVKVDSNYTASLDVASKLKPLATQVCYATKIYPSTAIDADYEWQEGGNLFSGDNAVNKSLKEHYNTILLKAIDQAAQPKQYIANADYILHAKGNVASLNTTLIFKLLVWIDSKATLESTGALTSTGTSPNLQFYLNVKALQYGGGASFTEAEANYNPADQIPETIV